MSKPSLFSDGTISHWEVLIHSLLAEFFILTEFNGSVSDAIDGSSGGVNVLGNPGTWVESSVPEPSTLALLGVDLVGLLAGKRRQVKREARSVDVWEPLV